MSLFLFSLCPLLSLLLLSSHCLFAPSAYSLLSRFFLTFHFVWYVSSLFFEKINSNNLFTFSTVLLNHTLSLFCSKGEESWTCRCCEEAEEVLLLCWGETCGRRYQKEKGERGRRARGRGEESEGWRGKSAVRTRGEREGREKARKDREEYLFLYLFQCK